LGIVRVSSRQRLCKLAYLRDVAIALAVMLAAGTGDAAPSTAPVRHARIVDRSSPRPLDLSDSPTAVARSNASWAVSLPAIEVRNRNTNARAKIRLYSDDGEIDRAALRAFMRVAASTADLSDRANGNVAEPLDTRLVQLAFRAAYHFGGASIVIVSATRKGTHGKHGSGQALDFHVEGVRAATLAAHARAYPRAGVGIYTHPKTQYVHVDVRDRSYHWLDGSPPGVTWRERLIADPGQRKRDASYTSVMDLPEAASK
jgi:uncharacterized protein YcbK (DUF882 family)